MSKKAIVWDDCFYVRAYEMARSGLTDAKIAETFGVSPAHFLRWRTARAALRDALTRAREGADNGGARFLEYVYGRLPAELRQTWEKIMAIADLPDARERTEALLAEKGERARQHLFVYALVHYNFNSLEARRVCNLGAHALKRWKEDPHFRQILDEIHEYKGDFFESALLRRVREGDTACVIFANRTFNRDRGYGESLKVEGKVTQQHQHLHAHVNLDELDLDLETRKKILHALRRQRERLQAPAGVNDAVPLLEGPRGAAVGEVLDVAAEEVRQVRGDLP